MSSINLTSVSFFCGAGGMDLGFIKAGFQIIKAWDYDKYAVQTYKENVGEYVEQRDITKQNWDEIPSATVWTFGFPCTDLSITGKMEGMKILCQVCGYKFDAKKSKGSTCPECHSSNTKPSTKSGLFFEVMRLLEEIRINAPERLPAFLVAENVKQLRPYLSLLKLEYEKHGYQMKYVLWNAKYWGTPQNRERYFVVGIKHGLDLDFRFPKEQHDFVPNLYSVLESVVEEKYYVPDEQAQNVIKDVINIEQNDEHKQPKIKILGLLEKKGFEKQRRVYCPSGISPTLIAGEGGGHEPKVLVGKRVRKLTTTEYGRLQAFPMQTWKQVVSNSQAYKQFGNAVTVSVSKAIAEAIRASIDGIVLEGDSEQINLLEVSR